MARSNIIRLGALVVVMLAARPLWASSPWHSVLHVTKKQDYYLPEKVALHAEQATLATDHSGRTRWFGYSGPTNLHTRNLRFACRDVDYPIPQTFVDDLLWLGADGSVRASIDGRDAVFTMNGCDGEKGYTVHFHFRDGRFFQRILAYTEAQTMLIRTNDAWPTQPASVKHPSP